MSSMEGKWPLATICIYWESIVMPPNAYLVTRNHTQSQTPLQGTSMKLEC